ncbi:MAG: choice-of-anchor L domain-containing protein [Bacteroidetes bacterium]|nr:choice-of-anchor L domain-containing protein [Bacteroidota bacterium]
MKLVRLILFLLFIGNAVNAQLIVDNTTYNPNTQAQLTQLIQKYLLGSGVSISNLTYVGNASQLGYFLQNNSNIGLDSGLIMASGDVLNAVGPNNSSSTSTSYARPGETDLNTIASPNLTEDAVKIEFDFIPNSDTLRFEYVFASEEYMEYANSSYNDAFGFFLSGPGISGPYSNSAVNIALLPNTNTPVTINNVNLINNPTYYFDNGDGGGTGTAPDGQTVQYDGFTIPLTAIAVVQCGQTYHIKLALADVGDDSYDSGVFLKAGSFGISSGVSLNTTNVTCNGDGDGSATFTVLGSGSFSYNWSTGSTSNSITNLNGGLYTVTVSGNNCVTTLSVNIIEPSALTINSFSSISPNCNINNWLIIPSVAGGTGAYSYNWAPGGQTTSTISGATPGVYSLTVNDANNCTSSLTTTFAPTPIIPDTVNIATTTHVLCNNGNNGSITTTVTGNNLPHNYTWSNGSTTTNINNLISGTYTVTLKDANNCISTATTTITQPTAVSTLLSSISNDCSGANWQITASTSGGTPGYQYLWSNGGTNTSISPVSQGVYTITVTDANGCKKSTSTVITNTLNTIVAVVSTSATSADTICPNTPILFYSSGNFSSNAILNWSFDGGTILDGQGAGPYLISWTTAGEKTVSLFVQSATNPCDTATSKTIVIIDECPVTPINVVTPNGDNKNDLLKFPNLLSHSNSSLEVYSRWGKMVYANNDYKNDWNLNEISDGTYFYILNVSNGQQLQGFFTVIGKK